MRLGLSEDELPSDRVMMIKRLPNGEMVATVLRDEDSEMAVSHMRGLIEAARRKEQDKWAEQTS